MSLLVQFLFPALSDQEAPHHTFQEHDTVITHTLQQYNNGTISGIVSTINYCLLQWHELSDFEMGLAFVN